MPSIVASLALTGGEREQPFLVTWEGGRIVAIEPTDESTERLLLPGLVDLQVNGIDEIDVARADGADWEQLDRLLLAQGVTAWCPTLVSAPLVSYDAPLARIAAAIARPRGPRPTIAGAHLEGPFLGGAPGAHRREHIAAIDLGWLAGLPAHVSVVTLAPEQPQALEAIRLLATGGRLVALGHSTAEAEQFDAAVAAGARLTTHLFNGMSGIHHRTLGVAGAALTNGLVSASLIADGVHVHPRVLRLAAEVLGPHRTVLVTDSVAWRGDGSPLELRDGAPRQRDGTLAGSTLTMDQALRTCVAAGVDPITAARAASTNPAALLGLTDRGQLAPGFRADMVALDRELQVEQVWVGGFAALG